VTLINVQILVKRGGRWAQGAAVQSGHAASHYSKYRFIMFLIGWSAFAGGCWLKERE
jgi:hypothetical protein